MDLKTAVTSVLKSNYANFNGRARRSEYWYYWLFMMIVDIIFSVLSAVLGGVPVLGVLLKIVTFVVAVAVFIPGLAVSFRRLHDTGRSAWWLFISLIPLVGTIILIVLFVQDSQPGENKYGPCPK